MTVKWEFPKVNQVAQPSVQSPDSLGSATQSKLSKLKQQAYEEGYASGAQQAASEQQMTNQTLSEKLEVLTAILIQLESPLAHEREVVTSRLTEMVISLAKKLTGHAIDQSPEIIETLVKTLLKELPMSSSQVQCYLNPQDLSLLNDDFVQALGADSKVTFVPDTELTRGGCRIFSGYTELDASLESRLENLMIDLPKATEVPSDEP